MPRIPSPGPLPKLLAALVAAVAFMSGCGAEKKSSAPSQRAYVWQRDWSAQVSQAIGAAHDRLDGFVVLGAEIEWKNGAPSVIRPGVDWETLRRNGRPCGIALRAAPQLMQLPDDDAVIQIITGTAREVMAAAGAAQVSPVELQLDFDCPQKKLSRYTRWVAAVKKSIAPTPLVITTLPAWLDEAEFTALVQTAGRYVLQVHSLRPDANTEGKRLICDPARAKEWARRAGKLNVPFEIALPTYRYRAGYDAAGKIAGIESDSVRPSWPPGTRVVEFSADAAAMASLVKEWRDQRPACCAGLIWYRLPVEGERNNWPLPTLRAVMDGREPRASFKLNINGGPAPGAALTLADLALLNDGETDDAPQGVVTVTWDVGSRATAEALAGWEVQLESNRARFSPAANDRAVRLPPGSERAIGWLRLEPAAILHVEISR